MIGKILGQHEIGSAVGASPDREIVHESAHQKKSASRGTEQVFLGEWIRDVLQLKTASLIEDMHDQLAGRKFDSEMDFLLAVLAISVIVSVDHAFAHGHADFVDFILGEAGFLSSTHHKILGNVHAFQAGVEHYVQALRFRGRWSHIDLKLLSMGTIRGAIASMCWSGYERQDLTVA